MYTTIVFILLFFSSLLPVQQVQSSSTTLYDPALIAVLMVKDEAPVIVNTLEPLVKSGIDAYFVFDTGSTDNTIELTENYFKEHNITRYAIAQEPFVDFSTSRNRALELCEEKFPNGAFMLMLDAEWHLVNGEKLLEFCRQHADPAKDLQRSYLLQIKSANLDFHTQRLIRCRTGVRFKGVVHENPEFGTRAKVPDDIYFLLKNTRFGIEKTIKRMRNRDLPLLLKEYQNNPHNPRTTFYLAQTYECLGEWENAAKYYKRRTELKGWDEENFVARYKLALALEHLQEIDSVQAWPQALHYYLEAYAMRPWRIEPLVRVAKHYLAKDNFQQCYIFARRACDVPYPKDDVLFIEKQMYDYERYDILGRCAWYVGEFKIGEKALRKALALWPDAEHLKRNLEFYEKRKK